MMRPNRIGWGLAVFFFVLGAVFTAIAPDIWLFEVFMGTGVALAVFYTVINKRADRADMLIRDGIRGVAQILALDQTGMFFNGQPRIKLKLRVQADGVPPFESERTYTVPMAALGSFSNGGTLPVYLDPRDTSRFAIDWLGSEASDTSPRDRLEQLAELKEAGLISESEFQSQRARIIGTI